MPAPAFLLRWFRPSVCTTATARAPLDPFLLGRAALAWWFLCSPVLWMWPNGRSGVDTLASALLLAPAFLWRRTLQVLAWCLWLVGAVSLGYFFAVGTAPDEYFWFTLSASHAREALEYASSYRWQDAARLLAWSSPALWAARWLGHHAPALQAQQRTGSRMVLLLLALLWPAWALVSAAKGDSVEATLRKINRIYPVAFFESLARQQAAAAQLFSVPTVAAPTQAARADLIVIVIGESASALRWSLLGYSAQDTNAALRPLRRAPSSHSSDAPSTAAALQVLPVWSNGNNTAQTVPVLLSGRTLGQAPAQGLDTYLDWARAAGFRVVTISNQSTSGTEETFFHNAYRQRSHSYERLAAGSWDGDLTERLQSALMFAQAASQPLLVTLHTYGSHPRVAQRTPAELARWSDPYDNSIAYSSALLAQWIDLIEAHKPRRALLLYISDHGLNLPDCGGQYTHGNARSAYEVPLLLWSNTAFQADQPDWWQRLSAHAAPQPQPQYDNRVVASTLADMLGYGDALLAYPSLAAAQLPPPQRPPAGDTCHFIPPPVLKTLPPS